MKDAGPRQQGPSCAASQRTLFGEACLIQAAIAETEHTEDCRNR